MVGSEVDQKYLGIYAKLTSVPLGAGLYKLLGLSTLLSRKLLRARKQRKLDPSRTTKSLDLYRHIVWMAREGLGIVTSEVLPHLGLDAGRDGRAGVNPELKVLALKMHASFLHICVLFEYTYAAPVVGIGGGIGMTKGLEGYAYMAPAVAAFARADAASMRCLSSSHPLRLSLKLEYAAFLYDCCKDYEGSRRVAKGAVDDAFDAHDPIEDDAFQDAIEMVGKLGALAKRGLPPSGGSPQCGSTPTSGAGVTPTNRTPAGGNSPAAQHPQFHQQYVHPVQQQSQQAQQQAQQQQQQRQAQQQQQQQRQAQQQQQQQQQQQRQAQQKHQQPQQPAQQQAQQHQQPQQLAQQQAQQQQQRQAPQSQLPQRHQSVRQPSSHSQPAHSHLRVQAKQQTQQTQNQMQPPMSQTTTDRDGKAPMYPQNGQVNGTTIATTNGSPGRTSNTAQRYTNGYILNSAADGNGVSLSGPNWARGVVSSGADSSGGGGGGGVYPGAQTNGDGDGVSLTNGNGYTNGYAKGQMNGQQQQQQQNGTVAGVYPGARPSYH